MLACHSFMLLAKSSARFLSASHDVPSPYEHRTSPTGNVVTVCVTPYLCSTSTSRRSRASTDSICEVLEPEWLNRAIECFDIAL